MRPARSPSPRAGDPKNQPRPSGGTASTPRHRSDEGDDFIIPPLPAWQPATQYPVGDMTLELIDPDGLPRPQVYTQVVVGTGSRTIYVAGQVSVDAAGQVVAPGDLAGQARQAYRNVGVALAAAGAGPADVAKITTYVVGYSQDQRPAIGEARRALFGDHRPASTLVGVQALAQPEFLIEVEAIAVV